MKSGFRGTIDKILNKYGMRTEGTIGTVWSEGNFMRAIIRAMGFKVEDGIDGPNYDYIIMSSKKSTIENILLALTKVDYGCIVIFRFDGNRMFVEALKSLNRLGVAEFSVYGYNEDRMLGVLVRRKGS